MGEPIKCYEYCPDCGKLYHKDTCEHCNTGSFKKPKKRESTKAVNVIVWEILQERLGKKMWTTKDLAEVSKVSEATIKNMVQGFSLPSLRTVAKIFKVLDIDLNIFKDML